VARLQKPNRRAETMGPEERGDGGVSKNIAAILGAVMRRPPLVGTHRRQG